MSWVMRTRAMPRSRCSSTSSSRICAWMVTSSAVVGSSAIRRRGEAGNHRRRRDGRRSGWNEPGWDDQRGQRSEEHTSELQSLMRISYAVFCLKKKNKTKKNTNYKRTTKETNHHK